LAIVVSHPTQYYSPWFQWLSAHTSLDVKVFFLWDFGVESRRDPEFGVDVKWDVDLLSHYESEFVPNVAERPGAEHFSGFDNPELPVRLSLWAPEALLLFGYKWKTHIRTIAWARLHGVPILFRGDSHLIGRPSPGWMMSMALHGLFSQFSSFLYVGEANRDYFRAFGVPERKLFFSPHSVNSDLFDPQKESNQRAAAELRRRLGIAPDDITVLFAAKLVERKQPAELLEAFLRVAAPSSSLVFVGDGPELQRIREIAAKSRGNVHFLPFANQSEMPARLLMADIFALPSTSETWGLTVNEAMHMGTPCLVSDSVGCQRDLVTDGQTGWVFELSAAGSLDHSLSSAIAALRGGDRDRIRANVKARIAGYTFTQTTAGLLAALAKLGR
jgi:glycosyltransferase involved in cell wall biosynthesis